MVSLLPRGTQARTAGPCPPQLCQQLCQQPPAAAQPTVACSQPPTVSTTTLCTALHIYCRHSPSAPSASWSSSWVFMGVHGTPLSPVLTMQRPVPFLNCPTRHPPGIACGLPSRSARQSRSLKRHGGDDGDGDGGVAAAVAVGGHQQGLCVGRLRSRRTHATPPTRSRLGVVADPPQVVTVEAHVLATAEDDTVGVGALPAVQALCLCLQLHDPI